MCPLRPFLMAVEGAMSIPGKGTVATGRIERGMVKSGDTIEVVGIKAIPNRFKQRNMHVV